jgi:hypothetical protein
MLTVITLLVGLFLIIRFGYELSRILLPQSEKLECIFLGYLIGIGIFTFVWFLLNLAGIPYTLTSGLLILLSLNLILFILKKVFYKKTKDLSVLDLSYFKKLNIFEKVLLGMIMFLCISAVIQTIFWPIRYWDSLTLYDFRARLFVETGFMTKAISYGGFFGYPLLTSLSHTWVYLLGGTNPLFLYSLMYISLLVCFFFNLKKLNIGRTWVMLLTALVAVSPRLFDHIQWAYTNLPYSIYIILGSIYLYFGIKRKNFGMYILSAILIGISTWTRMSEPFWFSYIALAVIVPIFIKKWLWPFVYVAIVGSMIVPWRVLKSIYDIGAASVVGKLTSTSNLIAQILQPSVLRSVFDFIMVNVVEMYLIYFILLGIIILVKLFIKSKEWFLIILIIFQVGLVFVGTIYFVIYTTYWQEIPDSLTRMMMFIPVQIVFLFAELLSELKKR